MLDLLLELTSGLVTYFLFIYALLLCGSYVILGAISASEMFVYRKKHKHVTYQKLLASEYCPLVSIIAPAYYEERTIVDNVRSMLSLYYSQYELIIVNDGSTDTTLQRLIEAYELQIVPYPIATKLETNQVRAVYRSRNSSYKKILVVDKVNGGKADALNTGINYAQGSLVACVDVDCILENNALLKMVKPFLDSKTKVIAAGGVIRIANSCVVEDGRLVEVKYPRDFLARFQVIEYFRAFLVGRMAWSRLNGLLLVSGALGLFDKKIVIEVGGYDTTTVGEDMELVVRMRKHMAQQGLEYKVVYIPDPLCWTEAPSSIKQLGNQRNRWTRGTIETMLTHWDIAFNPKYKLLGLLSFPYWLLFEWFAPIIETLGMLSAVVFIFFGYIDTVFFISITLMVLSFAWVLSAFAILYEELTYRQYRGKRDLWKMFVTAILEPLIFHPLNLYWSVRGNIDFVFGKKSWGEMKRKGFAKK